MCVSRSKQPHEVVHVFHWEDIGAALPKVFEVLFRHSLKRLLRHINQKRQWMPESVFCQSKVCRPQWQRFIWTVKKKKNLLYLYLQPFARTPTTSWRQLIICPLNLILLPCAKAVGMENQGPFTNARSYTLNAHPHIHTDTHQMCAQCYWHTNMHTADAASLSVRAENQTLHPSAPVIPNNQSYVAMVHISPHELVCQTAGM